MRITSLALMAFVCLADGRWTAGAASEAAFEDVHVSGRRALLVGCTRYPHLEAAYQLRGPANDVLLMKRLLVDRFHFPEGNVVVLAEPLSDAGLRPTRANIEREFRQLAAHAKQGDQVVILLAGHGSQQPSDNPRDPHDPEPDGLDEIFLPADIRSWDGGRGTVENAICDDDLRSWLGRIKSRGAAIWIIVDACHSGTMVRGNGAERLRQVPADVLVPQAALQSARSRGALVQTPHRGDDRQNGPPRESALTGDWVAIYASQPTEPTVERPLPEDNPDSQCYGLLTYAINQVLAQAATPITYTELVKAVNGQYAAWGRSFPTPLIEGTDRDREVLGGKRWPGRSRIRLRLGRSSRSVDAGSLLGLTPGSVLAVYPPAGAADTTSLLGHVRVKSSRAFQSEVECCAYGDSPARDDLPDAARCEIVFVDYGVSKPRLALDVSRDAQGAIRDESQRRLQAELQRLSGQPGAPFRWVDDVAQSDWFVRMDDRGAWLLPETGWVGPAVAVGTGAESLRTPREFGPVTVDAGLSSWLDRALQRIARVEGLLKLASPITGATAPADRHLDVRVELLRYAGADARNGTAVTWQPEGLRLVAGDVIGLRVNNRSRYSVDVTLLFIDSGYGISPFFPQPGTVADNRLPPGGSLITPRARVTATTTGQEHIVVIAVRSQRFPVDFSCLAQPTLGRARSVAGPSSPLESPLGQLLRTSMYGGGKTRGLDIGIIKTHSIRCISWTTMKR